MNVGLFIGTETFTWKQADFQAAAQRAKKLGIDTLFIKVADGTELWYGGYSGIDGMLGLVKAEGVTPIPYLFSYADTLHGYAGEVNIVNALLGKGYDVCMDMESAWNGNTTDATSLAKDLHGKIWVSTWADPAPNFQNWEGVLKILSPVTKAFLPQVYTAFLQGVWQAQYHAAGIASSQIIPTFNSVTSGSAKGLSEVTLWEYHELSDASILQVVSSLAPIPLILSPTGCVADLVKSYQLDGGSQDKCGPWSVAELHYAGLPGHGSKGTANDVQSWAHVEYTKYIGPDTPDDQQGSSIDNMHQFLKDAGLHWWDITGITPQSKQSDDLARLHRALDVGYPVLVTVNEQSVIRKDGSNPYPWQPGLGPVTHIFTAVGHTKDGYLLVDDELNQGDAWPDHYSEAHIECHWASIVQLVGPDATKPWLKPIPSDDPTSWPARYNAQNFGGTPVNDFPQEANDCWNSVFVTLQNLATALKLPLPPDFSFAPPTGTDIFHSWQDAWTNGHQFGPPLTFEYASVRHDGTKIIVQEFAHARCEWDGKAHWYGTGGMINI